MTGNQRRSSGQSGHTQELSHKLGKSAHHGSQVGHRATFEQGCLSVLPHLQGPCKALSLPGEHLLASRIAPDRMRPIIFHAFGKAKLDAPLQLDRLADQGWETLPIALLGMPHCPAVWIGGCCFTGGPIALTGNSAFRFCLLLQWHAIVVPPTALFPRNQILKS